MSSRFGPFPGIVVQEGDNEQSAKLRLEMVEDPWLARAEMVLDFLSHFPGRIAKTEQWNPEKQSWEDRLWSVLMAEQEEDIKSRVVFRVECPQLRYWTRDGLLTRMIIMKPNTGSQIESLAEWTVVMFFDHHQREPLVRNGLQVVAEDRFIVAWYANWRKWSLVYKEWSWAARKCEVQSPFKVPNSSVYFEKKYLDSISKGETEVIPEVEFKAWLGYTDMQEEDLLFEDRY